MSAVTGNPAEFGAQQTNAHCEFHPNDSVPNHLPGLELNTEDTLRLGQAVVDFCKGVDKPIAPGIASVLQAPPEAAKLVPLLEEVQVEGEVTPDQLRRYRRPLMELRGLGGVDRIADAVEHVGLRFLGNYIQRRVEKKVSEIDVPNVIEKARKLVADAEADVNFIASFENPRDSFTVELDFVAQHVTKEIEHARDLRVSNKLVDRPDDTPNGKLGFVIKVIRRVKSFFGWFRKHRNRSLVNDVTAQDAAVGIERAVTSLTTNPAVRELAPMLSRFALDRLPAKLNVERWKLALGAPEILEFLYSGVTYKDKYQHIIDGVQRNPHELRFVTKFAMGENIDRLHSLQTVAPKLLPAIRDMLPTSGFRVRKHYDQLTTLLQPLRQPKTKPSSVAEQTEESAVEDESRLKRLKRRLAKRRAADQD